MLKEQWVDQLSWSRISRRRVVQVTLERQAGASSCKAIAPWLRSLDFYSKYYGKTVIFSFIRPTFIELLLCVRCQVKFLPYGINILVGVIANKQVCQVVIIHMGEKNKQVKGNRECQRW